jgi:predicted nucleotidyltransferase
VSEQHTTSLRPDPEPGRELEGPLHTHYPPGEQPSAAAFEQALSDVVHALDGKGHPYVLMGGVSTAAMARPRHTDDIDLFVTPDAAPKVTAELRSEGFDTVVADPDWLHKAFKHGVLVDIIFRSVGDIYLDDEMLRRAQRREIKGVTVPVIPPEDLLVIKAVAANEDVNRHWYDAQAIIAGCDLDWDYLLERALSAGPRRVLSLLIFAESNDHAVPAAPIQALSSRIYPSGVPRSPDPRW